MRTWIVNPNDEFLQYVMVEGGTVIKDFLFNPYCKLRNIEDNWLLLVESADKSIRNEFAFEIDKTRLNFLPTPLLIRKRTFLEKKNVLFELDVFKDIPVKHKKTNTTTNLVLANCRYELSHAFELPSYFDIEVTGIPSFSEWNLYQELKKHIGK